MSFSRAIDRARAGLDVVHGVLNWVAVACIVGISLLIFGNIVLRNLLSIGLSWVDEMARFLHVTLVFLAVPVLYSQNCHIRLEALRDNASPLLRKLLRFLALIATVTFAVAFLKSDMEFMRRHWDVPSPAMLMPNFLFFGGPIVGISVLLIDALVDLVGAIGGHDREGCAE